MNARLQIFGNDPIRKLYVRQTGRVTSFFYYYFSTENWKCEFDEYQCSSGRCIPVVWQCDGKPDCGNHTDEYNCQSK